MLKNKVIFVTGSSRGIGKATAAAFAAEGCSVVINCAHSEAELLQTEEELKKTNPNIFAVLGDVSDYDTAQKIFEKIKLKYGAVDVLVNNAGISYIGLFNTMRQCDWQKVMRVNFDSVMNCTYAALQDMINKKSGCIINISSMWGQLGASCEAVYSASKGAVNSFTKAIAKEVAPCGIRVNAIACGAVETSMNSFMSAEEKAAFTDEIPLMRFGRPREIADTAVFLADKGSYITGQIIGVDGGLT